MNKCFPAFLAAAAITFSCTSKKEQTTASTNANEQQNTDKNLISYVNPLIGTDRMGHTFPGAAAPFGMVQLSPETNIQPMFKDNGQYNGRTYEYCAGYQYSDSTIFGFAHTHFSGTGHSDLGDFLVMPTTGELNLEPGKADDNEGYHSSFSHKNEYAEPGYYKVKLDKYDIEAELTATQRVGFHRYTFPKDEEAHIILDMTYNIYNYDGKNVWTFLRVENDSTITGYRQTNGWARTRLVYFTMKFSKPFKSYGQKKYDKMQYNGFYRKFDEAHNFPEMAGHNIKAYFNFDVKAGEKIEVKMALSPVSMAGAVKNLQAEAPGWDFDQVKKETQQKWNNELDKVEVSMINKDDETSFYTSLYHTMLDPVVYEDVDGKYRGLDQNIHESDGFTNYTIFSLWDTYRALHPLYNIIQPSKNNDFIKSMLAHQEQSVHHMLPIWSHYANENWCMTGYHAVTVLADAAVKGVGDFDKKRALKAAVETSNVPYFDGVGDYIKYGYVPEDKSDASVSKTLEYAFDDWTIAQLAKTAGDTKTEEEYLKRSKSYEKVYDPSIGFMRPKLADGSFKKEFDPLDTHGQGFIEGNAWNYGLYVPQNIDHMIEMMGGKEKFSQHLDSLFTMELDDKYIEKNEDITRDGIIGNYVHGNEPSHHIPYLYDWTGEPYKTQHTVRMVLDKMYLNKVDGLCGNDDAGQMSAWYIFSALGFYPVIPGSDEYALGSPLVKNAKLKLENGNTFTVSTENQSRENVYVEKVTLNGKELTTPFIKHADITSGGELKFYMSSTPNKEFGKK
ncbi:GH92 family glycosyl hydrolase [Zhouia sp. PK063]|uniref:GH92 family glycosyl hydrolase n=1 Tax=Zhouia sp. PK063 TaxID=3373602 RepID=UPI00379452A6